MALNDGIAIPVKPNSTTPVYINSGAAWPTKGWNTTDLSGTPTVPVIATNGSQSWSGVNTFTHTGSSEGYTEEGFPLENATFIVQNISSQILGDTILAGLGCNGDIRGDIVYNAVWNDIADCIEVPEDTVTEPGYCYCFDGNRYYKSSKYKESTYIGIHSDTAGMYLGSKNTKTLNIAVGGFVLAYVDKEYKPGTPLTCTKDGRLTKIRKNNRLNVVGYYWKPETSDFWGPEGQKITVNNRHWVKVK